MLDEDDAEQFLPPTRGISGWTAEGISIERQAFLSMAVVHALRPDRTMAAAAEFVEKVFAEGVGVDVGGEGAGEEEQHVGRALPWDEALDVEEVVREGARPEAPILLCSDAGHDASWKVLIYISLAFFFIFFNAFPLCLMMAIFEVLQCV